MKGNWLNNAYVQVLEEPGRNDSHFHGVTVTEINGGTTSLSSYTH